MEVVFFDLETTGLDTKNDRIIEIALVKKEIGSSQSASTLKFLLNPRIPINPDATAVHGISDADVANCPTFKDVMFELIEFIGDHPIAGFNSNAFDVPMLFNEFARNGYNWDWKKHKFIDVGNLFKIKEPRTLSAASLFYLNKDHSDAHSAVADVICTADVLDVMIHKYNLTVDADTLEVESRLGGIPADINRFFSYNEAGVLTINFGKYRGNPALNHVDYLEWMWKQDFPADTKKIIEEIIF